MHLILDRGKVAAKYYFSASSKDRTTFQRKRNKKVNSKSILKHLKESIHIFSNLELNEKEEEEDLYENLDNKNQENYAANSKSTLTKELASEVIDSSTSLKRSMWQSNASRINLNSVQTLTMMMIEKKNEENALENCLKDFEKIKNFDFYYPKWNVDQVLKKFEEQRKKRAKSLKKRTHLSNRTQNGS